MTNNLGRSEYDLKVKFNHVIGGILSARKNESRVMAFNISNVRKRVKKINTISILFSFQLSFFSCLFDALLSLPFFSLFFFHKRKHFIIISFTK